MAKTKQKQTHRLSQAVRLCLGNLGAVSLECQPPRECHSVKIICRR